MTARGSCAGAALKQASGSRASDGDRRNGPSRAQPPRTFHPRAIHRSTDLTVIPASSPFAEGGGKRGDAGRGGNVSRVAPAENGDRFRARGTPRYLFRASVTKRDATVARL